MESESGNDAPCPTMPLDRFKEMMTLKRKFLTSPKSPFLQFKKPHFAQWSCTFTLFTDPLDFVFRLPDVLQFADTVLKVWFSGLNTGPQLCIECPRGTRCSPSL